MKNFKAIHTLVLVAILALPFSIHAETSVVGVQGYDLVSYHQDKGPVKGSGFHATGHEGTTYIFKDEANLKAFKANPDKYLPQYGGFCAYGAALGKKFVVDPTVYKVIDGKLYLNLNNDIAKKWNEDLEGNIKKADDHWKNIKDTPADKL